MNKFLALILITTSLFSCADDIQNKSKIESKKSTEETPIVGRWKLQSKDSKKPQPTEVILSLMEGGYFVIYDTFVDPKFDQKGFNRISERSKGQWEFIDNKRLILHYNYDDSTRLEEVLVTTLNKNTLVTKGENKKSAVYKTYKGY